MILKGSQRGGAKQLGLHLLKTKENEHVEIYEIRGFMSDDVVGALREAEAVSKGTQCRQYLFSVSLNPPETENVRVETFKNAINKIEERNGLQDQPRVVVFHEKEGRRHAHAVWSRIDGESMTARPLPYFKNKLQETSRELYRENGWDLPRGLIDKNNRDPRNFTLAEWQQAKRMGRNAGEVKGLIQEAWAISDSKNTFSHALEERGFYLARGDKRGHVAVTFEGEVISIPRATGQKSKDIKARLGQPTELRSIEEARKRIADDILPRMKEHLSKAQQQAKQESSILETRKLSLAKNLREERAKLDDGQKARFEAETQARAQRFRGGMRGFWDKLTGTHSKLEKQNQMEALWALGCDQEQRQALVHAQLQERQKLQTEIKAARSKHAKVLRDLHSDTANYRLMNLGEEPILKRTFERQLPVQEKNSSKPPVRNTKPAPSKQAYIENQRDAYETRLRRLRERQKNQPRGPQHSR